MLKHPKNMTKKQIYNDQRYKTARGAALRRARFRCEECARYGKTTTATTVHHIQPIEAHPELVFRADNLRALCPECHNKAHPEKGGGRGRTTRKTSKSVQMVAKEEAEE